MEPLLISIKGHEKVISLIKKYDELNVKNKKNIDKLIYELLNDENNKFSIYLELFFQKVVKKQIDTISKTEKLLNKFIVKGASNHHIYEKYIKNILKMEFDDYNNKLNQIIANNPNKIDLYILNNIGNLNFDNYLEMKIMDDYIARKLSYESKLANNDIRIIVKFLIEKFSYKTGLNTKVNTITFLENINEEKLKLPVKLKRIKTYIKTYGAFHTDHIGDGYIIINTDNFRIQKMINPYTKTQSLFQLLLTCFHELQHARQNQKSKITNKGPMSLYAYKRQEELFVINNNPKLYLKKHDNFYFEIEADIIGCEYALNILRKYSFKRYEEIKDYALNYLEKKYIHKNLYDDNFLLKCINIMLQSNPNHIKEKVFLQLEYNEFGLKKSLVDFFEQQVFELMTEDLMHYIIIKKLFDTDSNVLDEQLKCLSNDKLMIIRKAINSEMENINKRLSVLVHYTKSEYISDKKLNNFKENLIKRDKQLMLWSGNVDDILNCKKKLKKRY